MSYRRAQATRCPGYERDAAATSLGFALGIGTIVVRLSGRLLNTAAHLGPSPYAGGEDPAS
jgi:hypothetical protein